ncbi:MFS general substrate transporter [Melanomma pulvis-pyrius CBS 109.77]|uniref:MFS general substrate transporter n=1 Tax=Melanomma pulvis-pyrius CBS 109.77 TaxID=1314802 RepID=A0A6A6XMB3_9PLEO|nr:MFS general substrate transporter [Melanomma pulvis-pyrius CBS 109.77]
MAYWHGPSSDTFNNPIYAHIQPSTYSLEVEDSLDGSTVGYNDGEEPQHLPSVYLIALTCGVGGLQLVWSTLFSHGSSYLFTLGVSKSQSSLVWAAAPICGAIVQPLVGAISDRSQSSWGRRRPFILGGAIAVAVSITVLAWIEPLISAICDLFQLHDRLAAKAASPYGAILALVILNVAIQPLQFGIRALIVDACPSEQQSIASAWAGRFTGIGNIVAYIASSLPLPFSFMLGNYEQWRFRYMSLLSVAALAITTLVSISCIHEDSTAHESYREPELSHQQTTPLSIIVADVVSGWKAMSLRTRRVCRVQFFAWMGWFAFHFYSTSYMSSIYLAEIQHWGIDITSAIKDDGMRIATLASLLSAIAALGTTIILPYFAAPESKVEHVLPEKHSQVEQKKHCWMQIELIWASSHILYAMCAFSTMFVTSSTIGTVLVALIGLSMGVTQWAPFALIGEELASRHGDLEFGSCTDQSGAIMGIHNAATSIPQVLAALVCSCVFWIAQRAGVGERSGTSWVLSLSGVAVVTAAWFAWRLGRRD